MGYDTARARLMSLLGAFALMAMIVRGLVPAGYMLAAPEQPGQFVNVVICHGDRSGTSPALLDLATGNLVDPDDRPVQPDAGKHWTCPYAMTAHFAAPPPSDPLIAPFRTAEIFRSDLDYTAPGRGLAAPPPPARGPPTVL